MRLSFRPAAALAASLLLSACVEPQNASQPTGTGPVKAEVASAAGGPAAGNTLVLGSDAYRLFEAVCLKTLPRFKGAKAAALQLPTAYNSTAGVYVHRRFNLSFKIVEGPRPVCSMVFASGNNAQVMTMGFTLAAAAAIGAPDGHGNLQSGKSEARAPNGTMFMFETMPPQGGVPFYHAYVALSG